MSSGFFGFFAHAGFLAAIRQVGITPTGYGGSSSGAIVAAMAAARMNDSEIRETLFSVKKAHFWDPDPWSEVFKRAVRFFKGYSGYLKGEGYARLLARIPVKRIEDCAVPLVVAATNLTLRREERFTSGDLIPALQASGAVPGLFKPVEISGSFMVDGGVVDKAPVLALADLIEPERIIVHYIRSGNLGDDANGFLRRKMTPWAIHHLSGNIARHEAYRMQCDAARARGIEVLEVDVKARSIGPNRLDRGPGIYEAARKEAVRILKARLRGGIGVQNKWKRLSQNRSLD